MGEDYFNTQLFYSLAGEEYRPLKPIESVDSSIWGQHMDLPWSADEHQSCEITASVDHTPGWDALIKQICGSPCTRMMATMKVPCGLVPVKRHKKWRVQKKWNKRYGMKTSYRNQNVEFDTSCAVTDNRDGTYTYDLRGHLA